MSFGTGIWVVQAMRKHRKELNARKSEAYFDRDIDSIHNQDKIIDHKKMSPAQFTAFKEKVAQREKDRLKRLSITFGSVVLLLVSAAIYFLFFY